MGAHNDFGKKGEELAVDYLVQAGYRIVHTNYRYQKAEIDIIAQKEEILAIVEVKSRKSDFWQHIAEIITDKKIKLLVKAANQYVISRNLDIEVRFDIITVLEDNGGYNIDHIENAFYHF
jgi:putative endonuclease